MRAARSAARWAAYLNPARECVVALVGRLRETGAGEAEIASAVRRVAEREARRYGGENCVPELHALVDAALGLG